MFCVYIMPSKNKSRPPSKKAKAVEEPPEDEKVPKLSKKSKAIRKDVSPPLHHVDLSGDIVENHAGSGEGDENRSTPTSGPWEELRGGAQEMH